MASGARSLQSIEVDHAESKQPIRTLRLKVRAECYPWLNRAAREVNMVFNFCNEMGGKMAWPCGRPGHWVSYAELCTLSCGTSKEFECIGADTIQKVCREHGHKRRQFKLVQLHWRKSFGRRRSLGWIPFKAGSIRRQGKYIRFCGKTFRFFDVQRFAQVDQWQEGCFAQDPVGDWWFCLPVRMIDTTAAPAKAEVGIDLGLKDTAVTSDGERLASGRYYRSLEPQIQRAQRRHHRQQVKRLHRRARRRRENALHQFSRRIVNQYHFIYVGDVSSPALAKTRMAKAVLDCAWGELRRQLLYKGGYAGRSIQVVNERNTTRRCSRCGALTGPTGVNGLRMRQWTCSGCGVIHDRDVNAARNVLAVGRKPPSLSGTRSRRCMRRQAGHPARARQG